MQSQFTDKAQADFDKSIEEAKALVKKESDEAFAAAREKAEGIMSAAKSAGLPWRHITGCRKNSVEDRPVTVSALLGSKRLAFLPGCSAIKKALASLRWDEKEPNRPEDKNIGNINDIYDSFCYCWLDFVEYIDRERVIY